MKLTLQPDPGTGHHWRLTLEIGDIELSCDVAERSEPQIALHIARAAAEAIGLVPDGPDAWGEVVT